MMGILRSIIDAILALIRGRPSETIETVLDRKAAEHRPPLQWRTSIVDLMKAAGKDSSLPARKQLAKELGYTGKLDGSAAMNQWLHARVLERLRNG